MCITKISHGSTQCEYFYRYVHVMFMFMFMYMWHLYVVNSVQHVKLKVAARVYSHVASRRAALTQKKSHAIPGVATRLRSI